MNPRDFQTFRRVQHGTPVLSGRRKRLFQVRLRPLRRRPDDPTRPVAGGSGRVSLRSLAKTGFVRTVRDRSLRETSRVEDFVFLPPLTPLSGPRTRPVLVLRRCMDTRDSPERPKVESNLCAIRLGGRWRRRCLCEAFVWTV